MSFSKKTAGALVASLAIVSLALPASAAVAATPEKAAVKEAVTHDATVFAATYAQARNVGLSHKVSVRAARKAIFKNTASPFGASTVASRSHGAISVTGGGVSYCVNIDFMALQDGYNQAATSKPKAEMEASMSSNTCVRV